MFKKTLLSLAVASTLGLTGCFDSGSNDSNANPSPKYKDSSIDGKTWPVFNPATSQLPLPNDLIFDREQGDGTFGVADTTPPVTTALNELSGASTVAPAVIQTNGQLDTSTVVAGKTVHLIELEYASGDPVRALSNSEPPTLAVALQKPPVSFRADVESLDGQSAIRIIPLKPLNPQKRYIVLVTTGVKDINGDSIIQDPVYRNITATGTAEDPNDGLLSSALAPVRSLVNGLWEPVAMKYAAAVGSPVTEEQIALTYSFTTSNDEKVLQYIAEPASWFADQLTSFIRSKAAQTVVSGKLDVNADGTVDFKDTLLAADGAIASFPDADTKAALSDLFSKAPPLGCDTLKGNDAIECVGVSLSKAPSSLGGFADLLPTPSAGTVSASESDKKDAVALSVLLSNIVDPGEVSVVEGSVTLPYYLGTEGASLVTDSWQADSDLAAAMNGAFESIGLSIPQADPAKSTAVNYIFPFPQESEEVTVPMLIIYSNTLSAMDGTTPVVIFQHGITTDRSAALAFGSALANATGAAVIAIDQPLHGVSPFSTEDQLNLAGQLLANATNDGELNNEKNRKAVAAGQFSTGVTIQINQACPIPAPIDPNNPDPAAVKAAQQEILRGSCGAEAQANLTGAFGIEQTVSRAGSTVAGLAPTNYERHFNFTANAAKQPVPMVFDTDKALGESGSLFINLSSFLTSRDNLRQGAVDLMNLRASLSNIDLNGDTAPDLDTSKVFFAGHSLGTINGTAFVASVNANQVNYGGQKTADDIVATNMLTPGGGVTRLLENSQDLAPVVLGGLKAAAGLEQGDANLETFLNVFQAAIDSVDPVNFTDNILASKTPTLLSEIIGDTVIPNSADPDTLGKAFPAPLAGTEPLATHLGASSVTTGNVLTEPAGITRYIAGTHGTPAFPKTAAEGPVFTEMVSQAASFFFIRGGQSVDVSDDSVVQQ
ncbi:MAG: hypothetical protein ABJM19_06460 [Marinobacter sp.]|uniref:hypothetical protein n=1 Tax=Marinobacter sp. TaxID=50741 RepID=UPI0032991E02